MEGTGHHPQGGLSGFVVQERAGHVKADEDEKQDGQSSRWEDLFLLGIHRRISHSSSNVVLVIRCRNSHPN